MLFETSLSATRNTIIKLCNACHRGWTRAMRRLLRTCCELPATILVSKSRKSNVWVMLQHYVQSVRLCQQRREARCSRGLELVVLREQSTLTWIEPAADGPRSMLRQKSDAHRQTSFQHFWPRAPP